MQILTVVLGIVFILLLLSLLASTIMEFISSIFGLRGQNLLKALKNLLEGYKAGEGAVVDKEIYNQFIKNPLYRQLSFRYGSDSSKTSPPSYISSKSFQSHWVLVHLDEGIDVVNISFCGLYPGDIVVIPGFKITRFVVFYEQL